MSQQEASEKISQQLRIPDTLIQELLALEVDTEVLYKELIRLADLSGRIGDSFRVLRLSVLEQELPD